MADPALPPGFTLDAPASSGAPILLPSDAQKAWDAGSASLEQQLSAAGYSEAEKSRRRTMFFNDPRIQRLREAAASPVATRFNATPGPPVPVPVSTKRQEIQNIARQAVQQRQQDTGFDSGLGNFATALKSGIIQGANTISMGLPNVLAAGAEKVLPSAITGNDTDASFMDILRTIQAKNQAEGDLNGPGNFIGQLMGSIPAALVGTGTAASALAGTKVADAASQASAAMPLATKLASAMGAGALGGGAGALSNGQDPVTGAEIGTVAGPVLQGGAKVLGILGKKAADVLGIRNIDAILRHLTPASKAEIQTNVDKIRATGVEPSLFEALPLAEQNRLASNIGGHSDPVLEHAQATINQRLSNIPGEMANSIENAAAPARADATQQMTDALTAARGSPAPGDAAQAAEATTSPLAMAAQPGVEAGLIMGPHDTNQLFDNISQIIPHDPKLQPNGEVHMVESDTPIGRIIRSQAGLLPGKNVTNPSGGLTGNEVGALLDKLKAIGDNYTSPNQTLAAQAVKHIESVLAEQHPEYLAARQQMKDQFAARSRMVEGASEGMNTRTAASLDPNSINQEIKNAYGSTEGATGRALGQSNELQTGFAEASPSQAVSQAAAIPGNMAAITQNLGSEAAGQIAATAESQTNAAQALARLNRKNETSPTQLGPDALAGVVLGLHPAAMIRTKIAAIQKVVRSMRISEQKAKGLVDLVFSPDANKRQMALDMLGKTTQGQGILSNIATSMGLGGAAAQRFAPEAPQPIPALDPTAAPDASPTDAADPPLPEGFTYDAPAADSAPTPESAPVNAPAPAASIDDMLKDPEVLKLLGQNNPEDLPTPNGAPSFAAIQKVFPNVDHPTSGLRSIAHNREVGGVANSLHLGLVPGVQAYDIPPQAGMTIHEAAAKIEAENPGVKVVESLAHRARKPDGSLGGYHWHFALAHA
jgi:hypothetical protein